MAEKYPKIIVFHIFVCVSACVRVRDFTGFVRKAAKRINYFILLNALIDCCRCLGSETGKLIGQALCALSISTASTQMLSQSIFCTCASFENCFYCMEEQQQQLWQTLQPTGKVCGGIRQIRGESRNKKKRISIDEQQSEKCQSTVISKKREREQQNLRECSSSVLACALPITGHAPLNDAIPTWVARPEIVNGNVLLGVRLS